MADLVTNKLDFGGDDTFILRDARVDNMYTNAQIDSALATKADTSDIPTVNDAVIVIKQGGVEKGRFTVNASQNVEISLDSGSSIDAYTKTESDSRFASKSIYGDYSIQLDNSLYSVSVGYNNRDSNLFSGNAMIGSDNVVFGATYNNTIIGHNNEISKSATSGDKNIVIGNYIDYQGEYGVAIGYDENYMEVCPNGDVIVRGDVQCSDGSGGTVSLKNAIIGQSQGLKILYGRSSFPSSTAIGLQSVTINFSEPFSQAPTVLLTWSDSNNGNVFNYMDELNVGMDDISKNSFTAQTKRKTANYVWWFNWIAIGKA